MDTWGVTVDQLVRTFHDTVTNVLTDIEKDCRRRGNDFTVDFIDVFYNLLNEKFTLIGSDNKWKWKTKYANNSLIRTSIFENNNSIPSLYSSMDRNSSLADIQTQSMPLSSRPLSSSLIMQQYPGTV